MTNFDLDDPLGDLLSEGSDDSFFDEPKALAKRSSISKTPEKKKTVTDLFGLEDKPADSKADDWLGLDKKKEPEQAPAPRRVERPAKKISFEEDDDIFSNLGLDAGKPKAEPKQDAKKIDAAKKSSLMESILGPPKEDDKKFLSLDDLLKESKLHKKTEVPPDVSQSTSQLPQKTEAPSAFGLSSLDAPREGRRTRPKTANIADPLGLFTTEAKPKDSQTTDSKPRRREPIAPKEEEKVNEVDVLFQAKDVRPKSTAAAADVPDWLGGTSTHAKQQSFDAPAEKSGRQTPVRRNSITKTPVGPQAEEATPQTIPMDSILTQQRLTTSHMEYQNASIALQQQESQVLVALQLRKYEENMAAMQRKQQDVIIKQEQQFSHLLERQFAKQQIMENNMHLQQERINNHIHLLLSQPPIADRSSGESDEKIDELKKAHSDETVKQFEDIIGSIKARQHEEMFLLEESYKKQLSTIEQSMESVENHLKMELDASSQKNREKLELAEAEYQSEIAKYKKKIEEIYAMHDNEMRQLRENNNRVLEEIKFEYNTIIENLKESKQLETSVLQGASVYSEKLDVSLKLLDINSRSLLDIKERVEKDYGVLTVAREESLKVKQEEINMMRMALEKARELADTERSELMSLVRNLEIKLAEHSHNSREERFALQQAASTISARSAALEREADFNRSSLEREREQLNLLRTTILAEQEKAMLQITDEKLAIHTEKVRLETSAKLTHNYDTQRAKAEMEAAMEVAKEAAELTDRERENILRQLREVESLKRNLGDRERKLVSKERDLEVALEHANRKSVSGERALEQARTLQASYNERLREIQTHMSSLSTRERKLAEEKIALSRERVDLHNAARQIKKCGLCAVDNMPRIEDDNISEPVEQDIPRFISMSDADMFRLQLQMSEDQLTSNHGDDRISIN